MPVHELVHAYLSTGVKIDSLWSMYIGVHLALFWLVLLVHRPLLWIEGAIAFFAYTFFVYINGNALQASYAMLEAMRSDIVANNASQLTNTPSMFNMLSQLNFTDRPELIFITHGVSWALVTLTLVFRNFMIRSYFHRYPVAAQKNVRTLERNSHSRSEIRTQSGTAQTMQRQRTARQQNRT